VVAKKTNIDNKRTKPCSQHNLISRSTRSTHFEKSNHYFHYTKAYYLSFSLKHYSLVKKSIYSSKRERESNTEREKCINDVTQFDIVELILNWQSKLLWFLL
jgi:hypothetical protein